MLSKVPHDTVRKMDMMINSDQPIGVLDSGVGGLSVLKAIRSQLPDENVLYLGDQAHVPYGPRAQEQIKEFSAGITQFLLEQGAKLIVVACNTASAAALHDLRKIFPEVPFVGMEPAVKPAAETTKTGKVGVLATPTTFAGDLYASVVERFGQHVEIYQSTCPGLVEQIEIGDLESPEIYRILNDALRPMLEAQIDTIVLGCTHYPFVIPVIQSITGSGIRTIDPAPAVARQVTRLLEQHECLNLSQIKGEVNVFTSGDPDYLNAILPHLLGEVAEIEPVHWVENYLVKGR